MGGKIKFLILPVFLLLSSCSFIGKYVEAPSKEKVPFSVVWSKNLDPEYQTGNLPIALNSPLIHEEMLFIGHNEGKMLAFDLRNGTKIWSASENGSYHSQPVFFKDQIIYGTTEGRVYSRDYSSGKLKYSVDLGASVESKGVIQNGRIFFHLRNHKIFCLDVMTGKILWAYKRSVPFLTTLQRVSTPLVVENRLYVGFADGSVAAFSVEDGMLLWEKRITSGSKFIDVDSSPLLIGDKLVVGSLAGPLTVMNPSTGAIIQKVDYFVSRSPSLLGNEFVLGTVDGNLVVLDDNLRMVREKNISEGGISSIVQWKNGWAVSTVLGELFYFDTKNFSVVKKIHLGNGSSAIFGTLQVFGNKMALMSSRNRLYVFE